MSGKKTRAEVLELVGEFREALQQIYGERLKRVYLYGSYARGKADEDSDIDVAIVLEGPVKQAEELERVSQMRCDLSLRENCLIMPFFLSETEYETKPWAIHRSIAREGVPV